MSDTKIFDRLPDELPSDPMHWADAWLKEALATKVQRNPNSMTIATVGPDAQPSARVVLCKDFVPDPGYLVFYTNYRSRKSVDLEANPYAAALIHWDALGRQIRIEGTAVRSPAEESDAYFATRDWGSKLGAWGCDQSKTIASHDELVNQIRRRARSRPCTRRRHANTRRRQHSGNCASIPLGRISTVGNGDRALDRRREPHS